MPDPRHHTEWQQPADRHSRLIDPVLSVQQLARFEVFRRLQSRIDHALVFSTAKGGYVAFLPPHRPGSTRGYTAVYEVDTGVHHVSAEIQLPSDNDAHQFVVVVELSWRVADPARFVESGHRDVPRLLLGELEQAARPVARHFAIADSARAEAELLRVLPEARPLGQDCGLQTTWTVRLRRDQENIDHQLRMQAIHHSTDEQLLTERLGMRIDVQLDQRARQQDELTTDRALVYGGQQHQLTLQQQQWEHQRRVELSRQQAELQRVEAEKIAFYQWHLQQGGVHAWALHLAEHPEDSALVMRTMREDQLQMIRDQMSLVSQVLADGGAERHELQGPKQLALRAMNDILNQRLPGVPHDPPPPYPGQLPPPPPPYGQTPPYAPHPQPPATSPGTAYGAPLQPPAHAQGAPYGAPAQPPAPGPADAPPQPRTTSPGTSYGTPTQPPVHTQGAPHQAPAQPPSTSPGTQPHDAPPQSQAASPGTAYGAPLQPPAHAQGAPHQAPAQPPSTSPGTQPYDARPQSQATSPGTAYGAPPQPPAPGPADAPPQPPADAQGAPHQGPAQPRVPGPGAPYDAAPLPPAHGPARPYGAPAQPPVPPAAPVPGAPYGPPPTFAQWEPPPGYGTSPVQQPPTPAAPAQPPAGPARPEHQPDRPEAQPEAGPGPSDGDRQEQS
ncbi:hypothetical protein [Streptomyces sp. NBC_01408]|uniref:hypothetical protein n=1 Tax=Streptomyces sp. NBC_01408 TaxID=2903855 RepID=UPI002250482B|nr:hypothetical protein [Streptomyces sp. NBC_01408]MCX4691588.1 hypothetical protein [Streptomyces sp. NBC_01408]